MMLVVDSLTFASCTSKTSVMLVVSYALGRAFQWPKHREVNSLNPRRPAVRASHSKTVLSIKNSFNFLL